MSCKPKPDVKPYRRKPKDVVAFQWDGEEVEGFERFYQGRDPDNNPVYVLVVNALSGAPEYAQPGDWIVTEDDIDAVYPPDHFAEDFEPA